MIILAIDPGPVTSGYVCYVTSTNEPHRILDWADEIPNTELAQKIALIPYQGFHADELAIEYIASYGMLLDDRTLRTQYYVGYFSALFQAYTQGRPVHCFYRKTILTALCGSAKAKSTNLKSAICNLFDEPAPPKRPKGPLKGLTHHAWDALAVALTRGLGHVGINHTWGDGDAQIEH